MASVSQNPLRVFLNYPYKSHLLQNILVARLLSVWISRATQSSTMPLPCVVCGCKVKDKLPGVSFHLFPTDEKLFKQWLLAISDPQYPVDTPQAECRYKVVCSQHFRPEDYEHYLRVKLGGEAQLPKQPKLKKGAVPSIFPPPPPPICYRASGLLQSQQRPVKH